LSILHNGAGALSHPAQIPASPLTTIAMRPKLNTLGPGHDVRYGAGTRNFSAPFSFSDEVNGRVNGNSHQATKSAFQHPTSSGAKKSDRNFSIAGLQERNQHPASRVGRNPNDGLTDKSKKQKGIPFCMIHSCQSLSEPCKRKLKLCSEHKVFGTP
jgi:hypothetical protein